MGLWWKQVGQGESLLLRLMGVFTQKNNGTAVILDGDSCAWTKENAPLFWRFQHKWKLLHVEGSHRFRLFFDDGIRCMEYRHQIDTNRVGVRIGSDEVAFAALDAETSRKRIISVGPEVYTRREIKQLRGVTLV